MENRNVEIMIRRFITKHILKIVIFVLLLFILNENFEYGKMRDYENNLINLNKNLKQQNILLLEMLSIFQSSVKYFNKSLAGFEEELHQDLDIKFAFYIEPKENKTELLKCERIYNSILKKSNSNYKINFLTNYITNSDSKVLHNLFRNETPVFLVLNDKNSIIQALPLNSIKNEEEIEVCLIYSWRT